MEDTQRIVLMSARVLAQPTELMLEKAFATSASLLLALGLLILLSSLFASLQGAPHQQPLPSNAYSDAESKWQPYQSSNNHKKVPLLDP
eukprot:5986571-Amphidinium_carterae.1